MKPGTSPLRRVRAGMLGGCSVTLSVVGHLAGGGHVDPVFLLLLSALAVVAAYGWLSRERGLASILAAVCGVQVIVHVLLGAGHFHADSSAMLLGHACAAVVLAGFLRWGEARVFAAARGRYLRWLVALRAALAETADRRTGSRPVSGSRVDRCSALIHRAVHERAPPVAALC